MKSLLPYDHITYDANCLIYYCMHSEIKDGDRVITVVFPDLTDRVREITALLLSKGKQIKAIEIIYEEIAKSERAGLVVNTLISKQEVRSQLGLGTGEKFPPRIKLRFIKSLDKKIRGLKGKSWFEIVSFTASSVELGRVRSFYQSLSSDPRMKDINLRKRRTVCYPSEEDMHLLIFSLERVLPVVSNDSDLTKFKKDLELNRLCHKIVPLLDIKIDEPVR